MTAEPGDERLLTVTDVAKRLQVHPITVRRHIKAGKLRALHVGRNIRIRNDDLDAYLRPESEEPARFDREESKRLLTEARRLLRQMRVELPQHRPPLRPEPEPRRDLAEVRQRRTNGQGRVDAGTTEVVGQHSSAREEYSHASEGNGRRF